MVSIDKINAKCVLLKIWLKVKVIETVCINNEKVI